MMKKFRLSKIFSLLLVVCILLAGCSEVENILSQRTPGNRKDYNNTVTALDVGQASCTLIESDGQFALIDAGKSGGSTDIVAYLRQRDVQTINLLVLTHFHYDHTSEAMDIIRNFDVETVLIPTLTRQNMPDTYFYKSLLEDTKNGYYNLEYAVKDKEFTVGSGSVKVLADTPDTDNINNTSIALSYTLCDFVYVNTGDTEADADIRLVDVIPENVDLFTAAHHGSQDANSFEFLQKLNPSLMVISCGEDNDYGHPHKNFLQRADELEIPYLITYEQGNIVYSIDSKTVIPE